VPARTSWPKPTGRLVACSTRDLTGTVRQPTFWEWTAIPRRSSTMPVTTSPTARTPLRGAAPASSSIVARIAARTLSGPLSWGGVGRPSRAVIVPSRATTAPLIVVPPTSRATTRSVEDRVTA
jgi:hypothetical protein